MLQIAVRQGAGGLLRGRPEWMATDFCTFQDTGSLPYRQLGVKQKVGDSWNVCGGLLVRQTESEIEYCGRSNLISIGICKHRAVSLEYHNGVRLLHFILLKDLWQSDKQEPSRLRINSRHGSTLGIPGSSVSVVYTSRSKAG
jgi:hypothetical protein